jgi:carbamoyltransferase
MLILGLSGLENAPDSDPSRILSYGSHDSAAILLADGRVVAAAEEERFNRVKHTGAFPASAIAHCLSTAGATIQDVAAIAVGWSERAVRWMALESFNRGSRFVDPTSWFSAAFRRSFDVDVSDQVRLYDHHACHAASAFWSSGFAESLVVTLDAAGDSLSGSVSVGKRGQLTRIRGFRLNQSLGFYYDEICRLLGYHEFDEYKVMGLAPYGDPDRFADLFARSYTLLADGDYQLRLHDCIPVDLLKSARRRGEPFRQQDKDLAAGVQQTLERIALHVLTHFRKATGQKKLCLAGGVAHNCSMNGRVLYSGLFDEIYVQPAAHDAGISVGAAILAARALGMKRKRYPLDTLFLGTDVGTDDEIESALTGWADRGLITCERLEDACKTAADLIAAGRVVAWVQGRSEFGPRALGNRSILADPRPAENKARINAMVKKREGYRPFAPSVQVERAAEYFDIPPGQPELPHMIFVLRVRPKWRRRLAAVTHVDGTARVQTVARKHNERYWRLLGEVGALTGIPMVLNTSLNNHAEPIVDSVRDAVTCFLTTGLDDLVVGNWLVRKTAPSVVDCPGFGELAVTLPNSWYVRRRSERAADGHDVHRFELSSTPKRDDLRPDDIPISTAMFGLLSAAEGTETIGGLFTRTAGGPGVVLADLLRELFSLWQARAVSIQPPGGAGPSSSAPAGRLRRRRQATARRDRG